MSVRRAPTFYLTLQSASKVPEFGPELSGRNDAKANPLGDGEQVGISGDDHVNVGRSSIRQHPSVRFVSNHERVHPRGLWNDLIRPQESFDLRNVRERDLELLYKDPSELLKDGFPDYKLVLGDDDA